MTDRQAFYNEMAQEKGLDAKDIEEAFDIAIHFLILRNTLSEFLQEKEKKIDRPDTIGIHVQDTIKTVDRLG